MNIWIDIIMPVICSVLASSGVWAYLTTMLEKKSVKTEMLVGLAHDRICHLGMCYVERGYITQDEYENLHDYLYVPYSKMGGNGSARRIMDEVNKLPIRNTTN